MTRGITEDDVWQAADALLMEGSRPTIERVRQKIGRGSPNTVSPLLDTWFKRLGTRVRDPRAFAKPSRIPEPVAKAAEHFWDVALSAARQERSQALEAQAEHLRRETEALHERQDQHARDVAAFQTQRAQLESVLATMRQQLDEARDQLADSRRQAAERSAEAQAARTSAEQTLARVQRLQEQLDAQRAAADEERTRSAERAAANERRLTLEVDRAREALKAAQAEAESGARRLKAEAEQLRTELFSSREEFIGLERARQQLQAEMDGCRQALVQAQAQLLEEQVRHQSVVAELKVRLDQQTQERELLLKSLAALGAPAAPVDDSQVKKPVRGGARARR